MRVTMLAPALSFSVADHSFRFTDSELKSVALLEDTRTRVEHRRVIAQRCGSQQRRGRPPGSEVAESSSEVLHGNSEKNSVCCRVLADHRIGRLCADVRFNRSSDWSAASAASGVRGSAATTAARVRLGRGLLVSGQTSLRVARRVLDAAAVSRCALGLCPVRAEHVLRGILGREWRRDHSRSPLGRRSRPRFQEQPRTRPWTRTRTRLSTRRIGCSPDSASATSPHLPRRPHAGHACRRSRRAEHRDRPCSPRRFPYLHRAPSRACSAARDCG